MLTQVVFAFWKVDLDSAVEIVIKHLKKNEKAALSGKIDILDREFMQKQNYWKITGEITSENSSLTFEVWVDALTGSIKKSKIEPYSSPISVQRYHTSLG